MQLFAATNLPASMPADQVTMSGFVASFATSLKTDLKRAPTDSELQQVMNCFDPIQLAGTLNARAKLCALRSLVRGRAGADDAEPARSCMRRRRKAIRGTLTGSRNSPARPCTIVSTPARPSHGACYYHDSNDVLELYPALSKKPTNNTLFEGNFLTDVAGDNLATYSFIIPAFVGTARQPVNSMHAPADVRPAEKLVADVYSAFRSHPEVWKKTLVIVVFDEHGGYYDHVPPPATVSPDNIAGRTDKPFLEPFAFDRLGLRVPALLISPWFPAAVDSTVYSHATIPGSLIEAWSLPGGFLTKRDAERRQSYRVPRR